MSSPVPASVTELLQVVLPNDANPMGFMLGGSVMHLIDIAGAIAASRHTRAQVMTAAVDGVQFLHPIKVGDLIILRARVTAVFHTSLEVEVEVSSESLMSGTRQLTSVAYLTFVVVSDGGVRPAIPELLIESDADKEKARQAGMRRAARLAARQAIEDSPRSV